MTIAELIELVEPYKQVNINEVEFVFLNKYNEVVRTGSEVKLVISKYGTPELEIRRK